MSEKEREEVKAREGSLLLLDQINARLCGFSSPPVKVWEAWRHALIADTCHAAKFTPARQTPELRQRSHPLAR